jgi:hypothetical protein
MIKGGPKIINDGLVLCLDAHDAKSYAGEPVTNLYGDMSTSTALRPNRTEYNTGGTWPTDMPMCPEPVGRVYKHTSGALTSSWSNNSYGYSYKDIATTSGETYICTCWVFVSIDSDIDYMYLGIEAYLSGAGIPSGYTQVYNLNNKGTWQLLALYVTADTNVRFLPVYPRRSGVTDGSFSGFYAWGGAQVVKANYVTPFVLSSRSATNGWVDRTTNNNDGTLTNMVGTGASHYRDGQVIMPVANSYLDFDGSDDRVTVSVTGTKTVEVWFNPDSTSATNILYCPHTNGYDNWLDFSTTVRLIATESADTNNFNITGGSISAGNWYQAVAIIDGTTATLYVDGSQVATTTKTFTIGSWSGNATIGRRGGLSQSYANAKIGVVRVYNKALTAAEVLSNYNATKGRFT